MTDSRLAALVCEQIRLAFLNYQSRFREISQRGRQRFLDRHWSGSSVDAAQRLRLYHDVHQELAEKVEELMGSRYRDRRVWLATKAVYSSFIAHNPEWEIAETFFNTLTRRVFATEGVDQTVEFVDTDFEAPPTELNLELVRVHTGVDLQELLRSALTDSSAGGFDEGFWEDLSGQLEQAEARIQEAWSQPSGAAPLYHLEMISTAFFRGRGAYLVGRIRREGGEACSLPLALCLRHESDRGIRLDAVLVDEHDLSVLFSYTRAYFRVDTECPYELVRQLRALLPWKRLVDLYNSIGHHRHGKTELYRDFFAHLHDSHDKFVAADGARGMVMLVFTLPSYDLVFKLIKDRFDYPKEGSRADVKQRYRLVFEHDRAGRLVEAHQFEHLRFPKERFDEDLLAWLLRDAAEIVWMEGDDVLIGHAYLERRVRPLNLFLAEVEPERAIAAALDYGQCIKDLAATNIFAGDIFTKNFGVTRTGRVVFYDYDELCFLTDCNFRNLPQATTYEQEWAAEPWYSVRDNDIFPEEFPKFLGLPESVRGPFHKVHGDLFRPEFWRDLQQRIGSGEIIEPLSYRVECRLPED